MHVYPLRHIILRVRFPMQSYNKKTLCGVCLGLPQLQLHMSQAVIIGLRVRAEYEMINFQEGNNARQLVTVLRCQIFNDVEAIHQLGLGLGVPAEASHRAGCV